jgi:hypothetical protein
MQKIRLSFAILTAILVIVFLMEPLALVRVADANPTWGTSATPIPPITDPPQITITSPNALEYGNPVPLNITIIQPNSWVSKYHMTLPRPWVDNSDSVVVGQNRVISITCIIDGQSFILWNGSFLGEGHGVTYYLPRVTHFSAEMNVSKGQHNLQVNVLAVSDYVVEGIIPFAGRYYNISASKSTTFTLNSNSDFSLPPTIDNISSSYAIWQSSSDSTPYLPPNDRNAPHLEPTFYLLPISVIVAIIVIAIIIYRRGRLASKQSFL